jgi:hypothetical protein
MLISGPPACCCSHRTANVVRVIELGWSYEEPVWQATGNGNENNSEILPNHDG